MFRSRDRSAAEADPPVADVFLDAKPDRPALFVDAVVLFHRFGKKAVITAPSGTIRIPRNRLRVFRYASLFMASASAVVPSVGRGQFQVIVTEHAGSITWQGIENVHLVANWREGHDDFLIPAEWQEKRA